MEAEDEAANERSATGGRTVRTVLYVKGKNSDPQENMLKNRFKKEGISLKII